MPPGWSVGGRVQPGGTAREPWTSLGDPRVDTLAELGIGLNPECRLTDDMLESEGLVGAVHIGTGTNLTPGGQTTAACRWDFLLKDATVRADEAVPVPDRGRLPEAIWEATG